MDFFLPSFDTALFPGSRPGRLSILLWKFVKMYGHGYASLVYAWCILGLETEKKIKQATDYFLSEAG
jgi:hypothetical protein